ncbi:hypothetical protein CTI12_AA200170 [Artemisia annua]|uniref:WEB family n=1 Tax=Artemisia annua TaxID=35608 RepID=A0A2U1P318_ARTAN|nr:hypothetical protein CTI12_AA200170 [Artemisia annua]
MGEIDTDSIKSVRASVSRFGEKCSQIKSRLSSEDESEKEKGLEVVLQDLANCKVQLEAMDAAHKQSLLNQNHQERTLEELSTLLKTAEFEKDIYINVCKEEKIRVSELKSKIQEMGHVLTELKSTEADAKLKAMKQVEEMETELTQLKLELKFKDESVLTQLDTMRNELEEIHDKENEAQVEIALLKAELHKGRSKAAAAEAAELKAKGEKNAAYFALQQMAVETQELKNENQRLQSEREDITITLHEYEILVKQAVEDKVETQTKLKDLEEMKSLKKDLENAMARVSEFRTRAEQAVTRAEVAELAKADLEEQIKGWKEQKQRRRAAIAALRAESMSKSSRGFEFVDDDSKTYMPLGKFLKMRI